MADIREPIETGSPDPFQYMHPTMRRNFGMWKYHTHPQPYEVKFLLFVYDLIQFYIYPLILSLLKMIY